MTRRPFATRPQTPRSADTLARFRAFASSHTTFGLRVTGVEATEPTFRGIDSSTGERIRFRQFKPLRVDSSRPETT